MLVLPDLGRCGQRWGRDDVAELGGGGVGGGFAEADGDGGLLPSAADADEPDLTGGSAAAAGAGDRVVGGW